MMYWDASDEFSLLSLCEYLNWLFVFLLRQFTVTDLVSTS